MNLPPFVYAKAFWEAVSLLIAGILALLVYFGVLPADYGLGSGVILMFLLAVLRFLKIEPELKAKVTERKVEKLDAKVDSLKDAPK